MRYLGLATAVALCFMAANAAEAQNTNRTVTTIYGHQPMTGFVDPGDRIAKTGQALTERQIRKGSEGNGTHVGGDLNVTTNIDRQSNVTTVGNFHDQSATVTGDSNVVSLRGGKQGQDGTVSTGIGVNQPGDLRVFGLPPDPLAPPSNPPHPKKGNKP